MTNDYLNTWYCFHNSWLSMCHVTDGAWQDKSHHSSAWNINNEKEAPTIYFNETLDEALMWLKQPTNLELRQKITK